ncbi:hypothetical protein E6H34_03650 [Candidatus Bathyarchaeota archaeon]|nr:MAG: hypothetical protein E6H34_03650 [Candidatus Bathyarchaeota archaeon]
MVTAKSPLDVSRGNRTRIGALGFPISGLVAASAALVPGIGVNPAVDPAGFAQAANYVGLANLAGLVSLVLLLFSFQALHAFLERNSIDRWAFAGMVLSVIGLCAFFSFLGIFAFAGPVAGKFYLGGDLKAASIISESTGISNPAALAFGGVSVLSSVLGAILFSVAIWRSGKFPKWSAFAYALSAPLNWIPHYVPVLWLLGGILLFGTGIARGKWKTLNEEQLAIR